MPFPPRRRLRSRLYFFVVSRYIKTEHRARLGIIKILQNIIVLNIVKRESGVFNLRLLKRMLIRIFVRKRNGLRYNIVVVKRLLKINFILIFIKNPDIKTKRLKLLEENLK